jgi:predicted RNase H-like HicB family nuclease
MATPHQIIDKTLDYYLQLPYPVLLIPSIEDRVWVVTIPLLPGCMTDGQTVEEALNNLKEAQKGWLLSALEDGDSIPEPQSPDNYVSARLEVRTG